MFARGMSVRNRRRRVARGIARERPRFGRAVMTARGATPTVRSVVGILLVAASSCRRAARRSAARGGAAGWLRRQRPAFRQDLHVLERARKVGAPGLRGALAR